MFGYICLDAGSHISLFLEVIASVIGQTRVRLVGREQIVVTMVIIKNGSKCHNSVFSIVLAIILQLQFLFFKIQSQGGHSPYTHTKKFSGNAKVSLQLHNCNPKVSAHFILRNLYISIKYPKTMQLEVRIASSEPRSISYTMFGVKNIMNIVLVLFGLKNITFGNILTQRYRAYLPVYAWADCSTLGFNTPAISI